MELTFWGVRGSIPAPGPGTTRYGGNTACVSLRTAADRLIVLDCGTGARNLGISLMNGPLGSGQGAASILLSHAHWDHIQGFPFFVPLYVPGNVFNIFGGGKSSAMLEGILEGQMAPQYFPVQTLKNMGATIEIAAVVENQPFSVEGCRVVACANPHGRAGALAFRIEEAGRAVVYASDAGYPAGGPPAASLALYRDADVLIHDSTYTPEDRRRYPDRGLSSIEDAVAVAVRSAVKTLVLFHYDQDYSDGDVDALFARGRRLLDEQGGAAIQLCAATEGATLAVGS
ncbi:MAG TPA: MBL fold metallo-hydrolase [Polyangia bacterium]|nr:MBL fold metallo-hydrolase [Polyangia bacterium]